MSKGGTLCLVVGEPVVGSGAEAVPFREVAVEVLSGLPVCVRPVTELPEHGRDGAGLEALCGEVSLVVVDLSGKIEAWLERVAKIIGGGVLHAGAAVLLLEPRGLLGRIPKVIHRFASKAALSRVEVEVLAASWRQHHAGQGWVIREWTAEELPKLIAEVAPDFLDTFVSYPDDLMRWGAARYFILQGEGGIVVQPGLFCTRPLDALLEGRSALLASQNKADADGRIWLTDAMMAMEPGHLLWERIEYDLEHYARSGYAKAVGDEFLTARVRDSVRHLPREKWPGIIGPEFFDPASLSEAKDGAERGAMRAIPWKRVPLKT